MEFVDVSDPRNPKLLPKLSLSASVENLIVHRGHVLLADGTGLRILDLSGGTPRLVNEIPSKGQTKDLAMMADLALVADGTAGLQIYDLTNFAEPKWIGSRAGSNTVAISIEGQTAYVSDATDGLTILDVSNPTKPRPYDDFSTRFPPVRVRVRGSLAYVLDEGGLRILDVSRPSSPKPLGEFPTPRKAGDFVLQDNIAFISHGIPRATVSVLDISRPEAPEELGRYDSHYGRKLTLHGNRLFVTGDFGLEVLDISKPAGPKRIAAIKDEVRLSDEARLRRRGRRARRPALH